jgi:hypothetical protein
MPPLDTASMAIEQQAMDNHRPVDPLVIGRRSRIPTTHRFPHNASWSSLADAWSGFADSVQLTPSHRGMITKQVPSAPRTWHRPVTPSRRGEQDSRVDRKAEGFEGRELSGIAKQSMDQARGGVDVDLSNGL